MMNFDTWKKLNESFGGSVNLGVAKPHKVGIVGLHQEWDDEDEENEDEDEEGDGKEGDLIGSSDEDEGPDKNFPPEFSGEEEESFDDPTAGASEFGEPEDDEFLSSIGSGAGGEEPPQDGGEDVDMGFLDDISTDLLGQDFEGGSDSPFGGETDLNAEPEIGAEAGGDPCPDCNPNGDDVGDPDCPTCSGEGFMNDLEQPDFDPSLGDSEEMIEPSEKMLSYLKKYMKKETSQFSEFAPAIAAAARMAIPAAQAAVAPMAQRAVGQFAQGAGAQVANNLMNPQQQQQQQMMMKKKMVKFMTKGGEKSFMAADAPRKYMKKDAKDKKNCHCEGQEFFDSLRACMKGNKPRNSSGMSEDALIRAVEPEYEEPEVGNYGFAPQGRVGGLGNGYTQEDIKDIPVLGESRRYPTLAEYAAFRHRKEQERKSRR